MRGIGTQLPIASRAQSPSNASSRCRRRSPPWSPHRSRSTPRARSDRSPPCRTDSRCPAPRGRRRRSSTSASSWIGVNTTVSKIDILLQVMRRRLRQRAVRIRARAPGVIDAAGIGAEIAAAVHGEDLQVGMALEHAVEDQVVQRDRGLERIADDVVEVEAGEPLGLGEAVGMDHHQRAELLGLLPERREGRIGQFLAGDVGEDFDALELELLHAALKLLGRLVAVRHRHAAERDQPVGVLADVFGDAVVERAASTCTAMSSGTV